MGRHRRSGRRRNKASSSEADSSGDGYSSSSKYYLSSYGSSSKNESGSSGTGSSGVEAYSQDSSGSGVSSSSEEPYYSYSYDDESGENNSYSRPTDSSSEHGSNYAYSTDEYSYYTNTNSYEYYTTSGKYTYSSYDTGSNPTEGGSTSVNHAEVMEDSAVPPVQLSSRAVREVRFKSLPCFAPIVQQHNYRKTDVKRIAETSTLTFDAVKSCVARLRFISSSALGRLELPESLRDSIRTTGAVQPLHPPKRRRRGDTAVEEDRNLPVLPITVMQDFYASMVGFETLMLAISVSLWGTVLYYNDLVQSACWYFNRHEQKRGPREHKGHVRTTFQSLVRWLNALGVDVLAISSDRRAASSFCSKRREVMKGVMAEDLDADDQAPPSATTPQPIPILLSSPTLPISTGSAIPMELFASRDAPKTVAWGPRPPLRQKLCRTLIVLEYDPKYNLWCPLTVSRPIREVAAARHAEQRQQRKKFRKGQRRERRRQLREALEQEAQERTAAKLAAWKHKNHYDSDGSDTSSSVSGKGLVKVAHYAPEDRRGVHSLPFEHLRYPTIVQESFGIRNIFSESVHPILGRTRFRLLVVFPLGILATIFGIALLILYVSTIETCFYNSAEEKCVSPSYTTSATSSSSQYHPHCIYPIDNRLVSTSSSTHFMFNRPLAFGNMMIAAIACAACSAVCTVLVVFFVTRFLAVGSVRPVGFYLLQGMEILLALFSTMQAVYALIFCAESIHEYHCSYFPSYEKDVCQAQLLQCPQHYFRASLGGTQSNVTLGLAATFVVFCLANFVCAFAPVLPKREVRQNLPVATPETYTFKPSVYAPDGMSAAETKQLTKTIRPKLRAHLRRQIRNRDRLLTHTTTIGEMMQANREQSMQLMELFTAKRAKRRAPRELGRRRTLRYACAPHGEEEEDFMGEQGKTAVVLSQEMTLQLEDMASKVRQRAAEHESKANELHIGTGFSLDGSLRTRGRRQDSTTRGAKSPKVTIVAQPAFVAPPAASSRRASLTSSVLLDGIVAVGSHPGSLRASLVTVGPEMGESLAAVEESSTAFARRHSTLVFGGASATSRSANPFRGSMTSRPASYLTYRPSTLTKEEIHLNDIADSVRKRLSKDTKPPPDPEV